ncbi:MAG TPA: phosphodiester glycosidase family protein [Acidimicrobiales bacterium]|nr:phosphodiester glycosidase family protein [Acidimicrobiales bacterium]
MPTSLAPRPVADPRPPRPTRRRYWVRRAGAVAGFTAVLVLMLVLAFLTVSIVAAWRTPGNEDFKAKWADWLRSHDGAFIVNPMEQWYYSSQAPHKGGRPKALNRVPTTTRTLHLTATGHHLRAPAPIPLVVTPALPGEGRWQPTGPLVDGAPGMYIAQFRADTVYTSQLTTAVWIDPTRLRLALVPGAREPGGTWTQPPYLTGVQLDRAVAAFNGGFRFQDAHGGFYLDGRTAVPLRTGAASIAISRDGRVNVGLWGRDFGMTTTTRAVLQNLVLLVDHGRLDPTATYTDARRWGYTLGANTVVARSGIGVTADGALVYVAGPALTVRTLAEALQRAGAVRAMTLDLNPEWVTFNLYTHPDPGQLSVVDATKLYPQMQRSATRYLGPTQESRDFFTVIAP